MLLASHSSVNDFDIDDFDIDFETPGDVNLVRAGRGHVKSRVGSLGQSRIGATIQKAKSGLAPCRWNRLTARIQASLTVALPRPAGPARLRRATHQ
jgi:hypothetical protein